MIKSLTVTNYRGSKLKIVLDEAEPSHGLIINNITGIGPSDANLNFSDYSTNDGSEFNSARLEKRSIQISLKLIATDKITVEEARHNTYIFFPTKKEVKLTFETDTRTLYCTGRVEHNTPDIFQQQEIATIDIVCGDPYFYKVMDGYDQKSEEFALLNPAFSSEYANPDDPTDESLSTYFTNEDNPTIETGTYASDNAITKNIINDGDIETGIALNIKFNGGITGNIHIVNNPSDQIIIDTSIVEDLLGESIGAGDEITLSTDPKYRYLKITHDGVDTNILNSLNFDTITWILLHPGDNLITYFIDSGNDLTEAKITYKTLYLGV